MDSLRHFAEAKLAALEARAHRRKLHPTLRTDGSRAMRQGAEVISFCCNDYLGLTQHPHVKAKAAEAIATYGAGSGASRLISGDTPILSELERRLARLKGTEDCVVFGSGYLANAGIVPVLAGKGDLVLADELAHSCLNAGAQLSRATVKRFPHNDLAALERLLTNDRPGVGRCLVLTDGVFSMDGDLAPLKAMGELCAAHDAWLLADDAHGIGVLAAGRGSVHASGAEALVPLQMGTLSKAIGSYGGYLCTNHAVAELMRSRARTFVYSTGLAPAAAGAALGALDLIEADAAFTRLPIEKARIFTRALGLAEPESPIVPLIIGPEAQTLAASEALLAAGYLVTAIRPPTVPAGTSRLRFTFTATHSDADVEALARFVRERILDGSAPAQEVAQ